MKISTKCRYGLRAMIYLAKHENLAAPIKRKDIARDEKIPHQYLENILLVLRKSGLIKTLRGASGGFVLARPAHTIALTEIINPLEGSLAPVDCVLGPVACGKNNSECEANMLWTRLHKAVQNILVSMTLTDLLSPRSNEWVI